MSKYTNIWEYRIESGREEEFEQHYAPNGSWAVLFRQSPGYIETLLLKDRYDPLHYLTIDRWQSEEQYRAFIAAFSREYVELDQQCEELTTHEISLGEFAEPFART